MASESKDAPLYFVVQNGEVRGPYDLAFIEAMVMSSLLPHDPQVQKEGSGTWRSLSSFQPPSLPPKPPVLPPGIALTDADVKPRSQPFPKPTPKKSNYGCLWGFLVLLGIGFFSNLSKQPGAPAYTPNSQPSSYQPPQQTQYQPPPPQTYSMTGGDGRTYRVSTENYRILSAQKEKLDSSLAYIRGSENALEAEKRQIERDRITMDTTSQSAVDDFNQEVDTYNTSSAQVQKSINAYNSQVNAFNAELERVGTPEN